MSASSIYEALEFIETQLDPEDAVERFVNAILDEYDRYLGVADANTLLESVVFAVAKGE